MRLPSDIPLRGPSDIEESQLIVQSFSSQTPQSFTVSLFTCDRSPLPCLLGSFSVERNTTESANRELARHQAKGDRIPLAKNIRGYLIEGPRQNPPYQFSTLMWQQNDMIYTISFPAAERQTIVFMATSMATEQPFYHRVSRSIPSF
jgi:hypothetical protein